MIKKWLNKIIEGDCLQAMTGLPDKCIDMVLCDLPYGQTRNPWDQRIDLTELWEHYRRIITDRGVIALTSHGFFTGLLISSNPSWFRYKIVWVKSRATNYLNDKKQPLRKHEDICIFYPKYGVYHPQMQPGAAYERKRKPHNTGSYNSYPVIDSIYQGHRYPVDVIYIKTAETEGPCFHPNQKPVALGQYLIRTFSSPGAIVLDNACGTGSFMVAAVKEGRQFIGMEKNEGTFKLKTKPVDFVAIARRRIKEVIQEQQLSF